MKSFARFMSIFGLVLMARADDVAVPGAVMDLQFSEKITDSLRAVARGWVENSAKAVAAYYGKFPVPRPILNIKLHEGDKATGGQASGWKGPHITVSLGRSATKENLTDDWELTHEMLHLCFPSLPERHHWLEEGLATYVEPIARARAGLITPERVWGDLLEGAPQGQPERGDRGLDRTHTWGRTYWGGALFCLRADIEIHRRTENRRGLENALRAIAAAGGTIDQEWKIDRVIEVGDQATGVPVLRELYNEMKETPVTLDLAAMWKELGVERRGDHVLFDDQAPLAKIRKAIMEGSPSGAGK